MQFYFQSNQIVGFVALLMPSLVNVEVFYNLFRYKSIFISFMFMAWVIYFDCHKNNVVTIAGDSFQIDIEIIFLVN